jgi:hypothetical protein
LQPTKGKRIRSRQIKADRMRELLYMTQKTYKNNRTEQIKKGQRRMPLSF